MDKTGEDWDGLHLGKFEKRRPTFFQIYVGLYQYHSQLLCGLDLQMKDSCSANRLYSTIAAIFVFYIIMQIRRVIS